MSVREIKEKLEKAGDKETARFLQKFFKTEAGGYGAGDVFRGIRVPVLRKLAGQFQSLESSEIEELLHSKFHEDRLFALLLLVRRYEKSDDVRRTEIYELYLRSTQYINNWDLVDASAEHIVGAYLNDKNRDRLYCLAESKNLWERRVAMMATFHFIKRGDFTDTLRLAEKLLGDREDLIHKAAGWMLRETGKRDLKTEKDFLRLHYRQMPRTMLRYAIEKFPADERRKYLNGEI